MAKVYFVREEISIEVPVGTSVLEAEIQAGLAPDVPCGGQGTCGKCLVKVPFYSKIQIRLFHLTNPKKLLPSGA